MKRWWAWICKVKGPRFLLYGPPYPVEVPQKPIVGSPPDAPTGASAAQAAAALDPQSNFFALSAERIIGLQRQVDDLRYELILTRHQLNLESRAPRG